MRGSLPQPLNADLDAALERFFASPSQKESARRPIDYNAKESKDERRFRIEVCVAIAKFVRDIERRSKVKAERHNKGSHRFAYRPK